MKIKMKSSCALKKIKVAWLHFLFGEKNAP